MLTRLYVQRCGCSSKVESGDNKKGIPSELAKQSDVTSNTEVKKHDEYKWRTPWHESEGKYYNTLRTFYSEDNNVNVMKFLQSDIDLRPSAIKKWWANRREKKMIYLQQYIPERNQKLGNELAAAHFIVHREGAVKFFGEDKWIKADEDKNYLLPGNYQEDKVLQAIDCTDVELYYEGLVNFRGLRQLEWFSINGCTQLDDWALDRISGLFMDNLLYLDIRNCPLITHRGLASLYKIQSLKILYVDELTVSNEFEMTCLMLQDINPSLDIKV